MSKLPSPKLKDLLGLQVAAFLPIAAPFWPSIRELTLKDMECSELPEGLAGALVSVRYLNLASDEFARLPITVKLLSNLQHLEIPENEPLQLDEGLPTLPGLHTLNVRKSFKDVKAADWSGSSVVAFIAISKRLPLLKLVVEYSAILLVVM